MPPGISLGRVVEVFPSQVGKMGDSGEKTAGILNLGVFFWAFGKPYSERSRFRTERRRASPKVRERSSSRIWEASILPPAPPLVMMGIFCSWQEARRWHLARTESMASTIASGVVERRSSEFFSE